MSLRLVLAVSAALALASPALAQEAPAAPPVPAEPAAAPPAGTPSDELMAAFVSIEAVGARLEAVMADLEPRAAAVRADAALSDEEKATRIRAMMGENQPVFDEFGAALSELIRLSAMAEGAPAEDAAAAASAAPAQMMAMIEQQLITGESGDEDEAAGADGHATGHEGH